MDSKPQTILTENAPAPAGHYSQAIRSGNSLYISGQLPTKADKALLADTSFEIQARQTIANVLTILKAAGGTPHDLCRVAAYIVGVHNWPEFNRVYSEMLGDARPARTVIPVPELHYGYLVEIDAIATLPMQQ
ncbi:MAG: RidA family protein [Mesorhizobium sp.]|uniref:RidA family protein n=1 Tax=Mesorhizobium sp. TaxID=1871066 RepID=UPI000FE59C5F|nr:RidA family protein [Mesorhizobium sp.]RWB79095.1 MAG: RidA family protein [Mesorhizobium sp.]